MYVLQVILFKLKMAKELALEAKWRVLSINPVSANVEEGSEQTALMLETTDTSRYICGYFLLKLMCV